MAKKAVPKNELLDRWASIEEEDDFDIASDHSKQRRLRQHKEEWFSDAFNFLISLPKKSHIWCVHWDVMGPLLETFFNYRKDEHRDSPLKILWKRISIEMRQCTQCICQHHQAQETYLAEYDSSSICPLLNVLLSLDEERITQHLTEMNAKIIKGQYDPEFDNAEVVSVMFEVLMFPIFLDDQSLVNEFQRFIEAVDDSHELTLAGHQQYPGVYALFFLKSRRARSIGFRLAGYIGKIRRATNLEPLQPLLKKFIGFLETEALPLPLENSRPRAQLERMTVWLGIKSLLGFLEPAAFEEGILDRYPIFLSIVLNHISDDSLEFSHAVNCLRLLFEMLGCKLWLRATLSPSVIRNTLLGQCFHTRNEKSHKEIFDLFQPFLQSLEPLQDGEHEKQRRHLIYFLLYQVTVSSNFSVLMRKKACQIALLIVHRGYRMKPPCPPVECAHMWGPFLVSSLKDLSLHTAFREAAIDLIQTIIVSDAAALMTSILNNHSGTSMVSDLNDEEDFDGIFLAYEDKGKDTSYWTEFTLQSQNISEEYRCWMCVPMLWFDVLVEIDPSVLPLSFSKAVLWALSHLSIAELENNSENDFQVKDWLAKCVSDISYLFGWKIPSGCDDGGDGKVVKNSIKILASPISLVRMFRRMTIHFSVKMEKAELRKLWTWEPRMGESLILLLFDVNDNARQVGKRILEQVSNTQGLIAGLQFLCSNLSSLSAIFLGLKHALKLVQLVSVESRFHTLHNLFFVLCKLLREGYVQNSSQNSNPSEISVQGGFLRQPNFDALSSNDGGHISSANADSFKRFSCLISQIAWPSLQKCLSEGKAFVSCSMNQMTCVRLLDVLPVVYEKLLLDPVSMAETIIDLKWLHDLIGWGKSSLKAVVRYWKQTVVSLIKMIKELHNDLNATPFLAIEKFLSSDNVAIDELTKQVDQLSVSIRSRGSSTFGSREMKSKSPFSEDISPKLKSMPEDTWPNSAKGSDVHIIDSETLVGKKNIVIILSDDETECSLSVDDYAGLRSGSKQYMVDDETAASSVADRVIEGDFKMYIDPSSNLFTDVVGSVNKSMSSSGASFNLSKMESDKSESRLPACVPKSKNADTKIKNRMAEGSKEEFVSFHSKLQLKDSSNEKDCVKSKSLKKVFSKPIIFKSQIQKDIDKASETSDRAIKELVLDSEDDPLENALKSVRHHQSKITTLNISAPKRQVIQLNVPMDKKFGHVHGLHGLDKRFKPPRLDIWYKPILEIDFFVTVGLASAIEEVNQAQNTLREVPISFQSADDYVNIFRPLVLEEFKAQLHNSFLDMGSMEEMSCGSLSVLSVERVDDFHIIRCVQDDCETAGWRNCSENDLVLLTRKPLQSTSQDAHVVGKVERREKDNKRRLNILVIRLYLQSGGSRATRVRKLLVERSKWFIGYVMNITPQLREFQALSAIRDIPLLPIILNPSNGSFSCHRPSKEDLWKLPQPLHQMLKSTYNDSQMEAISLAAGSFGSKDDLELSLIQGPPGTGKTRTILAIVSALLSRSRVDEKKNLQTGTLKPSTTSIPNPKSRISESVAIARAWQDAALARQINNDLERHNKAAGSCTRGRVLICAQSNAAVDEIVSRISCEGLYSSDGGMFKPYLVRVGNAKTVHPNSMPYFIDTLVEHRLAGEKMNVHDAKNDVNGESATILRSNLEKLVDRIRFYEAKRADIRDGNCDTKRFLEGGTPKSDEMKEISEAEIETTLRKLYAEKRAICTDLASAQSREKKVNEENRALKHKLRKSILMEAEIVVTTLSGCGGDLYVVCAESCARHKFSSLSENTLFDAVVIDEAAQALEPATLIPLQLLKSRTTKCIMVGDPKQLPATVLSNAASKFSYECSMFERLQKAGYPVVMLAKQYRMHPEICKFPSLHFYDGKLLNGEDMSCKKAPFHETTNLGPYVFFDVIDGSEHRGMNSGNLSLYNESEADAAVEVLKYFKRRYPFEFVGKRIGIITPYKCQLSLLRSRFSGAFGSSDAAEMEFNTVDGFQGREVDILLLSTVRASEPCSAAPRKGSQNIGFVADARRMNVALTRAKISLWILGNMRTLLTNQNWAALIKDAKHRNLVVQAKKPYDSIFMTVLKRKHASEKLVSSSRHPMHDEENKETNRFSERQPDNVKSDYGKRQKTSDAAVLDEDRVEDTHACAALVEAAKDGQSSVRNSLKNTALIVDDSDKKTCKDLIAEVATPRIPNVGGGIAKGRKNPPENKSNMGGETSNKNLSSSSSSNLVIGDSHKIGSSNSASGQSHTERDDRGVQSMDQVDARKHAITKRKQQNHNERADKGGKLMNRVDGREGTITKRKQRDAIDELLSTALISSKRSETKSKSLLVKRTISPASSSGLTIKPSKHKRG